MKFSTDTVLAKLKNHWLILLTFIFAIVVILFPYNRLDGVAYYKYTLKINKYNELGDFVGGITAPFLSLVAIYLLYLTYKSQKEELVASRQLLEKQSETLNKQQFETTFFNMLNLHNDIVNNIDLVITKNASLENYVSGSRKVKTQKKGRDCFTTFYRGLKGVYRKKSKIDEIDEMNSCYWEYYKKHQSDLGHYFRNLYHIYKLIYNSRIENKKEYASLVRAQLSSHELLMLFYNGLSKQGEKFKYLIEEFQVLKNMPIEDLISTQHQYLYTDLAYGLKNKFEINENMKTTEKLMESFQTYLDEMAIIICENLKDVNIINGKVLNTDKGIYLVGEIERSTVKELYFENELHNIFSSKGIKVSGAIGLRLLLRKIDSEDEGFMTHCIKVNFKEAVVNFDFNTGKMVILASGKINYTSIQDNTFC